MGQENVKPAISAFPSTYEFEITICFHKLLFFFPFFFYAILKRTVKCGKMIILLAIVAAGMGDAGGTHCAFPSGMCVCV